MGRDNAAIVRDFVDEVITEGNIEAAAQYVWEDVIEQDPLPGQGPGLDGLKVILRAMRAGFPDIVFSIQEQIAEDDKVASRFRFRSAGAVLANAFYLENVPYSWKPGVREVMP